MIRINSFIPAATLLLLAAAMTGCSQESGSQPAATVADTQPAPVAAAQEPQEQGAEDAVSELAGTAWRLVKISGMDDSVDQPEDRSLYTLELGADGRAALRADCNRGTGSWTSESPGQVRFGPIGATRAMCPPGSLSDKYLAQFEWVASYVMNEGKLYLATMADGAIIEFEPAPATQ